MEVVNFRASCLLCLRRSFCQRCVHSLAHDRGETWRVVVWSRGVRDLPVGGKKRWVSALCVSTLKKEDIGFL